MILLLTYLLLHYVIMQYDWTPASLASNSFSMSSYVIGGQGDCGFGLVMILSRLYLLGSSFFWKVELHAWVGCSILFEYCFIISMGGGFFCLKITKISVLVINY